MRVVIKSHYTLENPLFRRVFSIQIRIIGGIELYFYWNIKKSYYTKGNKIIEKKNVNLVLASWISTKKKCDCDWTTSTFAIKSHSGMNLNIHENLLIFI